MAEQETVHPFRVLPGGRPATPEEWWVAGVMLAALAFLTFGRRQLGHDATHVHAGGAGALTFLAYYLLATAVVRLAAAALADRDGPFARAVAFFA